MSDGKWYFIVNGTKLRHWEQVSARLLKQLKTVERSVCITKYPGHGRKLAERAALAGADLIAAVGGDGTLNEVIDGVMRAGVYGPDGLPRATVTILPLGTASDFHRSMAWDPNDFEEAMWRIGDKRGTQAVLDVAHVRCASPDGPKDRYFINVASCGASARAALGISRWRWLGRKAAYRMAAVWALAGHSPRSLAMRMDGQDEWKKFPKTSILALGNGSYFGHGLNIAPDANPFDGKLQLVAGRSLGIGDMLLRRRQLKMGTHIKAKDFIAEDVTTVEVAFWDSQESGPLLDESALEVFCVPNARSGMESPASVVSASLPPVSADATPRFDPASPMSRQSSLEITASEGSFMSQALGAVGAAANMGRSGSLSSLGRSDARTPRAAAASISFAEEKGIEKKKEKIDYGPMPLEVDGEVIGHVPFTVRVIQRAIKFRVAIE